MSKSKITQKEMFFYKVYTEHKVAPDRFVPAFEFVGEMHIPELKEWVLMSYKVPANGAAVFFENPGLIERKQIVGRSGSKYYGYRISPQSTGKDIVDPNLMQFYRSIRPKL